MQIIQLGLTLLFLSLPFSRNHTFQQKTSGNIPHSTDIALKERPHMQVVFALDATGSMAGLISAAKDKIWSIASSLSQTSPAPKLEIGLIFYRDRGDDFITYRVPLTDSIDQVYAELMKITADGGGDGPESVNQGLYEAVTEFKWAQNRNVYKTIFLIGDYPPHMDYSDDVKYPESCVLAKSKGIVLNTILMGTNKETEKVWNEISRCNEGAFVKVNMQMNDIMVSTPYDSEIAALSDSLESLSYYYGSAKAKAAGAKAKSAYNSTRSAAAVNVVAQRAEYKNKRIAEFATDKLAVSNELLDDLISNRVKLDTLSIKALPDELKDMSSADRKKLVEEKIVQKINLTKALTTKANLRTQYINAELAKRDKSEVENSFNNVIFKNIKQQAQKCNIELKGAAKY